MLVSRCVLRDLPLTPTSHNSVLRFSTFKHRLLHTARAVRILALESSADDTCAAIVDSDRKIHANIVLKQQDLLTRWGGIHPLHAATRHQINMAKAIRQCLDQSGLDVPEVDAIAYTRGPGMPSCLASCALAAKILAATYKKPLIGVHHMQAHALTVGLTEKDPPAYPYLTLLISGGHTLLLYANSPFEFRTLATSLDNSIGQAFDRVTRLLEIPWGGATSAGQALEDFVTAHPEVSSIFGIPMRGELQFSFSGLMSAVKREVEAKSPLGLEDKRVMAAAFQNSAISQLEEKITLALQQSKEVPLSSLVVSGGVAANAYLRRRIRICLDENGCQPMRLLFPPPNLCTDNAVMIAWAAMERYHRGMWATVDSPMRPQWNIEDCGENTAHDGSAVGPETVNQP